MKILWKVAILFVVSILVFALLYAWLEGWTYANALYASTMICTTVGAVNPPRRDSTKLLMSVQALITFGLLAQSIILVDTLGS